MPSCSRSDSAKVHGSRLAARLPLLVAATLAFVALMAVGLAAARPAQAASPTVQPFQPGRHVYDDGLVLSAHSAQTAENLAAHIESMGGGRVAIYTTPDTSGGASVTELATAWHVDGLLLTGSGDFGQLNEGATLKAKLTSNQWKAIDSSPGMSTLESWMLSSLARIDGFLSGSHVFDGAGVLDAAAKQKAEASVKDLGTRIKAQVYVDIGLGGDDPDSTAFFNGADLPSSLGGTNLVIALGVTGTEMGGYIGSSGSLFDAYHTKAPWTSSTMSNQPATDGDVQAGVLGAIDAVLAGSEFNTDVTGAILPWIIFAIVIVVFSITAPFLWGPWLIKKLTGAAQPIKNGIPTSAVIQSIADTGVTVTMPSVGPDAPEYKLGLLVTPPGGMGAPYPVEIKALIPRIYIPMVVPGATVGVMVDPANPMKVSPDWANFNNPGGGQAAMGIAGIASAGGANPAFAGATGAPGVPGMDLSFDAAGNPNMAELGAFAGAVNAGKLPTHTGSAAQLLATGTHGTAVITTAMPLGKTVRQVNPAADQSTLDDPVWMFTVEVSLAGQAPFPAVFGHRVPREKVAAIGPGIKLAVAVNPADRNQEVAIDWNQSPLMS
jgi:hypothetical protein